MPRPLTRRRAFATAGALAVLVVVATPTAAFAGRSRSPSTCAASGLAAYEVRSGDTWFGIAEGAAVAMASLLAVNEATVDTALHPGDLLCLPAGSVTQSSCTPSNAPSYAVAAGDSWSGIAVSAGVTLGSLLGTNGASADEMLHPGDRVCLPAGATVPSGGGQVAVASGASAASPDGPAYTVVSGDSWFGIAAAAGVTGGSLLTVNGATVDTPLHPGDAIRLPAGATVPTRRTSVALEALPVQAPCWYADTWHAPRSGGRRHVGVDLFARPGEYVYAVVDGTLTGRAWDQPGRRAGNAWWLTSADGTTVYFYAHLADFAPELKVGSKVRAGQIIGWVGATGNASGTHLHFEAHPGGEPVNPYPILASAGGCKSGTPYEQPGGWIPDVRGG